MNAAGIELFPRVLSPPLPHEQQQQRCEGDEKFSDRDATQLNRMVDMCMCFHHNDHCPLYFCIHAGVEARGWNYCSTLAAGLLQSHM